MVADLEAANLSPNTIKLYLSGVIDPRKFLDISGMPTSVAELNREHIEAYLVQLCERTSASTAATRYRGLRQMFKWLPDEGEINRNPFERIAPKGEETGAGHHESGAARVDQVSRRHQLRRPTRHGYSCACL